MVKIADVTEKIKVWTEKNIIIKIPGEAKRAAVAVVANRLINNAESALNTNNALAMILKAGNIVRAGEIDENALVEYRQELGNGKLEFSIPFVGNFQLDGDAIDSLYQAISSKE